MFTFDSIDMPELAAALGQAGVLTWSGSYHAPLIMERSGLGGKGGALRVGALHYNTLDGMDRLVETLEAIARGRGAADA